MKNNILFPKSYNPDVLSCLANLSNDEVFTSPEIVNQMLDLLPQELFHNPKIKFLDPACKTGVFLREIAKRLIKGLEKAIPDLQKRIDHIFKNQIYGIAITELTGYLSRRSLYCSKIANGKYSITKFKDSHGNIQFNTCQHAWVNGRCKFCGASKETLGRGSELETHAYQFIHTNKPEEIFKMKFDVIIGNPPYQLKTAKSEEQQNAISIYNLFIESAIRLNPTYISMIIPSRWMTGGRGLDSFREKMITCNQIKILHDFTDASSCFPGVEIKGGVCYFLWEKNYKGMCEYFLHNNEAEPVHSTRYLNNLNLGMVVRDNRSINIINKIINQKDFISFKKVAGSQTPFGIVSSFSDYSKTQTKKENIKIYGNKFVGFVSDDKIKKNKQLAEAWKVLAPKAVGTGNIKTDKINAFVPEYKSICTQTYIIYGPFKTKNEADNCCSYMKTKFFHFLLGQLKNTQQMSPDLFQLIPLLNFNEYWDDKKLYEKYNFDKNEIDFIEKTVWPSTGK